jgi:hypothetical protein
MGRIYGNLGWLNNEVGDYVIFRFGIIIEEW